MKTKHSLLVAVAAVSTHAYLARNDCGVTKSFATTNGCGVEYGGTWIECTTVMTGMPSFTVPECTATVSSGVTASVLSAITPAPTLNLPYPGNATRCQPLVIYTMTVASCGGMREKYGTCFDTCSGEPTLSAPSCTLPPVVARITNNGTLPMSTPSPSLREELDVCVERPYLCAPKGW
ncbi:hypothetical protein CC86DRAFT_462282 [Ophiobolus disseminans]|uniref:Uncharacterized protein n=1 Tax=Ophiobolus disseminans TaxID=1469910 RepID=A0A6A7AGS2_9PLEO|nr:hypothetical protein CC86DRAFT_462282 [Ophiobolus disseminans]